MKLSHNRDILTEISVWINKNNRQLLKGRRQQPFNRREIIKNLAQQSDIPLFPMTMRCHIFKLGMIALWVFGFSSLVFVALVSLIWLGASILKEQLSSESILENIFAMLASIWLLYTIKDHAFYMEILISYPINVRDLYQEFIGSGQIIPGRITNVEKLERRQTEIRYSFRQPGTGNTLTGSYSTTAQQILSKGESIAVLFLPSRDISVIL